MGSIFIYMRSDKQKIIVLRKQGLSYSQISNKTGVAKSTLSSWLKNIELSKKAQERIALRVNKKSIVKLIQYNKSQTKKAQKRHALSREKGQKEFKQLKSDPLFIAGVALYWAEGYKMGAQGSRWKSVDFANADSSMITMMMRFFRKFCTESDQEFTMQIIAHANVSGKKALLHWSETTAIPIKQFLKVSRSTHIASKKVRPSNRLPFGTLHIRINNVDKFFQLIGWIDEFKKRI